MSELQRYRVTGGVFLIALAVILLPMLFDGRGVVNDPLPPIELEPLERAPLPALEIDEAAFEQAEVLRESVDEEGFHRDTDTKVGHVVMQEAPAAEEAPAQGLEAVWGVQLASFSEHDNAVALRNRLRDDGYPALMSEIKQLTGVSTRVAIGPLLSRTEADALQQELSRRYDVDAIVVRLGS